MADAGISLPRMRTRRLRRYFRSRATKLVLVVWILTVTVFTLMATAVKYKLNSSESGVVVVDKQPELKLLAQKEIIAIPDGTSSDELSFTDDSLLTKEFSDSQLEESTIPEDIQPANVDIELEQLLQIDTPKLEESNSFPYVITAGTFTQYHNAEGLQLKLSQKGYQARIVSAISSTNQKVHVVIIPGFSDIPAAEVIAHKMKGELEECSDCFIATLEKPNYWVERGR